MPIDEFRSQNSVLIELVKMIWRCVMDNKGGFLGNLLGGNSEILFFILVFLLLFWGCTGPACDNYPGSVN
jgi:hypothetical protein